MRIFGREANNLNQHVEAAEQNGMAELRRAVADTAAFGLAAEWQQRGPETFSGQGFCKLRSTLALAPSAMIANPAG